MRLRISEIRQQQKITLERLADMTGISVGYLSRLQNSQRRPNLEVLDKIAKALRCSVSDLLGTARIDTIRSEFQTVPVIGAVQAGQWVEAVEWQRPDRYSIVVPTDPHGDKAYGLEVRGNSMNREFPAGSWVICVPTPDYHGELRSEMFVVVVRTNGTGEYESTVKQLMISDGKAWLWPRSSDPEHQAPISIPWPPSPDHINQDDEISIRAVVVGAYRKLA